MQRFGKIYLISNDLNKKVYVGLTTLKLSKRFNGHCCYSKSDRSAGMYIKRAIHKYGKEHFNIELIEEVPISLLNEREKYWIEFYDSYNTGYNLTKGGLDSNFFNLHRLENTVDIKKFEEYILEFRPLAKEVATHFGISKCSVYNLIKRLDNPNLILNSHNPRVSNAKLNEEKLCAMYLEGYNILDLVKIFKSSKRYISKVLKENGILVLRNRKHRI